MTLGLRPFAVTVNWNRVDDTVECVRSLLMGGQGTEVIVVDNGSTDGSVSLLRETFPGLRVLENEKNLGYTRGVNQGIGQAMREGATHILVINNDAVVRENTVSGLLEAMLANPQAGVVGPKIFYYGTDIMWFNGGHFNHTLGFSTHPLMDSADDGGDDPRQVEYITGCTMMVRADVFADVGLFDEDYDIYAEDLDFCLRAQEKGYGVWLVPQAIAEHKVSLSTGVAGSNLMTPYRSYFYGRNMLMLVRKRMTGLRFASCFLGQTFVLLPYYFLLMGLQGTRRSFRHYLRGYVNALVWIVRDG